MAFVSPLERKPPAIRAGCAILPYRARASLQRPEKAAARGRALAQVKTPAMHSANANPTTCRRVRHVAMPLRALATNPTAAMATATASSASRTMAAFAMTLRSARLAIDVRAASASPPGIATAVQARRVTRAITSANARVVWSTAPASRQGTPTRATCARSVTPGEAERLLAPTRMPAVVTGKRATLRVSASPFHGNR
jgi:hypothetical protein